jgi:F0F1-type ATP synthase assembly protein I
MQNYLMQLLDCDVSFRLLAIEAAAWYNLCRMRQAAAKHTTTSTDKIDNEMERLAAVMDARQQFLVSTADMSWRLAISVVIPIVAGVKLDDRFNTSPSLTLLGFMLAATGGSVVVWRTVKNLNSEQAKPKRKLGRSKKLGE